MTFPVDFTCADVVRALSSAESPIIRNIKSLCSPFTLVSKTLFVAAEDAAVTAEAIAANLGPFAWRLLTDGTPVRGKRTVDGSCVFGSSGRQAVLGNDRKLKEIQCGSAIFAGEKVENILTIIKTDNKIADCRLPIDVGLLCKVLPDLHQIAHPKQISNASVCVVNGTLSAAAAHFVLDDREVWHFRGVVCPGETEASRAGVERGTLARIDALVDRRFRRRGSCRELTVQAFSKIMLYGLCPI
jgi:hypothetical protein